MRGKMLPRSVGTSGTFKSFNGLRHGNIVLHGQGVGWEKTLSTDISYHIQPYQPLSGTDMVNHY